MRYKWISIAIICGLVSLATVSSTFKTSYSIGRLHSIEPRPATATHTQEVVGFTLHRDPGLIAFNTTGVAPDHDLSLETTHCNLLLAWTVPAGSNKVDHVIFYYIRPGSGELEVIAIINSPPYQILIDSCRLGLGFHQIYLVAYDSAGKEIASARILFFQPAVIFLPLLFNS